MTDPFAGVLVWIWQIDQCEAGDIPAIVARLKRAGAAGALIKDTDAGHPYNDRAQVRALVLALQAAGLSACTWSYNYDYDEPAEAAAQIAAIQNVYPSARVLDVEAEFEGRPTAAGDATQLAATIKAAYPDLPLAYSPVSNIRGHLRVPYRQFTDAGCVMLSQCYYTGYGWTPSTTLSQFYADVATYDLGKLPIYPAYEDAPLAGYGTTPQDLTQFLSLLKVVYGAQGCSVWSYQHLDAAGWERVAQAAAMFPATKPAPPPEPKLLLDDPARYQLVKYVIGGSGVSDLTSWLTGYRDG